ncbi:hypothetical protein [Microbacterium sp. A1-JK]|uniref:hypothetical protein n=1 Tax=Microbacterium sp. A1-JK TaxID=3177516 RepID=UPI00388585AD
MKVELNIPDKVWAEVLEIAETNHTSVARVIEATIRDAVRPSAMAKLHVEARRNHIAQLWGEGLTDAQIAERTGELKSYVATVRRGKSLPPNLVGGRKYTYERKSA